MNYIDFNQLRSLSVLAQFFLCHTCPFARYQWSNQRHFEAWLSGVVLWFTQIHVCTPESMVWFPSVGFFFKCCREQSIKDRRWLECLETCFRPLCTWRGIPKDERKISEIGDEWQEGRKWRIYWIIYGRTKHEELRWFLEFLQLLT